MAVQLVGLDAADAVELGELLEFLAGWLAREGDALAGSLACFVGNAGYDIEDLRTDLSRFAFLLGGKDGERLFDGAGR
jgi:hypothetical protein